MVQRAGKWVTGRRTDFLSECADWSTLWDFSDRCAAKNPKAETSLRTPKAAPPFRKLGVRPAELGSASYGLLPVFESCLEPPVLQQQMGTCGLVLLFTLRNIA